MRIHIASIGKWKRGPLTELFETYRKRTPFPIELHELTLKKAVPEVSLVTAEAKLLREVVSRGSGRFVALDASGEPWDSDGFAAYIRTAQESADRDLALLIGGANGLCPTLIADADRCLSLGRLTWPHLLVRVMLAEQLYRASTILSGHPYHRGH